MLIDSGSTTCPVIVNLASLSTSVSVSLVVVPVICDVPSLKVMASSVVMVVS